MRSLLFVSAGLFRLTTALQHNPYDRWHGGSVDGLYVDLGYEQYQGEATGDGLVSWLGIRYAASTGGANRFQKPQSPTENRTQVIPATAYPTSCAQIGFYFVGSEDCLFVNVVAPVNAVGLPVMVYIHGGGYTAGSGSQNHTAFITNNDNRFITVFIQYRLGVLGFLSSEEMRQKGQLNVGLLDIEMSLQWVQSYIHLFGGDPRQVTVAGESAGAGAVMLMSILRGGSLGESLFSSLLGASPYLPKQFKYNDKLPESHYYSVANETGCLRDNISVFDCLVEVDVKELAQAGSKVDNADFFYDWGLVPVTDGVILQDVPSHQLGRRQVNGRRILIGNNAEEGYSFVPQTIVTAADFDDYIERYFTKFSPVELEALKVIYPSSGDTRSNEYNYSTLGYTGPTALTMGDWSNGEQQRANNLQGEAMFMCPAYWLAEALPEAWKYEFSMPPAEHAFDVGSYFYDGDDHAGFTDDFVLAFQRVWGNFIVHGDPRIPQALACGSAGFANCTDQPLPRLQVSRWEKFNRYNPTHLSVNVTGGVPGFYKSGFLGSGPLVPQNQEPGLRNSFTVDNAFTWQGGRGFRCDFWRTIAPSIPG